MATESNLDDYSVKNLLFYRAIPNYKTPKNADGHLTYSCKDCGDRFIMKSSYQYHIQRKSVLITYKCRHCGGLITFYNRCNLLSHIRSHTFKTATINITDLKIEPLPLSFFKLLKQDEVLSSTVVQVPQKRISNEPCFECKKNIASVGPIYKDRANHYMEYTNKVYSCPVCLLTLPTTCALKAHLRIHLMIPPYYCPECGIHISNKSFNYPYNRSCTCEGFNMMRATARFPCPIQNCNFFHPNDFKKHMKEKHFKKMFSCTSCVVACFNEETMQKHLKTHENHNEPLIYYQCEMCPGRLVIQGNVESHLSNHGHSETAVYPCWTCSTSFKAVPDLINHHLQNHDTNGELKNCLMSIETTKKVYRVVKRCDQCMRNFTYKCHYEDINILPNTCPFNCTAASKSLLRKSILNKSTENKIKCPVCGNKIDQNWGNIKNHFALHHKEHRCGDLSVSLSRICIKKYLTQGKKKKNKTAAGRNIKKNLVKENKTQKPNNEGTTVNNKIINTNYICEKCQDEQESKEALETHFATNHRDANMAYQCMECGDCFVVKPSFSIHLLFHGISNIDEYITKKKCYNKEALNTSIDVEEPLGENQCKICRESFDSTEDLEKHFRVHGMAFLIKNSLNKPGPH